MDILKGNAYPEWETLSVAACLDCQPSHLSPSRTISRPALVPVSLPLACALLGDRASCSLVLVLVQSTKLKPYAVNEPSCGIAKRLLCGVSIYCLRATLGLYGFGKTCQEKNVFGGGGMSWLFRFSFFWKKNPLFHKA